MKVIPAIDLLGGRCVRLLRGDFESATEYSDDPLSVARRFFEAGARRIHVVDLDAARDGEGNRSAVEAIVKQTGAEVEVAGGIRSEQDARGWFDAGAAFVVIGTLAAEDPSAAADLVRAHPGKVCVAVDVRGGMVASHGWERGRGEPLERMIDDLDGAPLESYIYTDIERDGTLEGPNFEGLGEIMRLTKHDVVLSGGVAGVDDVRRAGDLGAAGVILGRALYENRITLAEALAAVDDLRG